MKKFLCLLLTIVVSVSLVACGGNKESANFTLEGTYAKAHTYQGNEVVIIITLKSDGTYLKTIVKDDWISSSESGDYELIGDEVNLYDSDSPVYHGAATVYSFKNGNLTGPDSVYKKISENN